MKVGSSFLPGPVQVLVLVALMIYEDTEILQQPVDVCTTFVLIHNITNSRELTPSQ